MGSELQELVHDGRRNRERISIQASHLPPDLLHGVVDAEIQVPWRASIQLPEGLGLRHAGQDLVHPLGLPCAELLHDPFEGTLGASIPRLVFSYLQNATYNMIGFGNIIKAVLKGQKSLGRRCVILQNFVIFSKCF